MPNTQQTKTHTPRIYPLLTARERLLAWKKVRGMWKRRKPSAEQELEQIRKEWDRELPSLNQ